MKKRALITGATSGIGRATALRLAAAGYEIVAAGRREERLAQLRHEIEQAGGRCTTLRFDVRRDTRDWDAMIDTNVKGLLYVTRVVAPKMAAAGGGHIVNIGSIAGTEPYENGAVYCASKHAVHGLTQAMRADLLADGIRVTEIRPGMVDTEFSTVRFHGDRDRADRVYEGVEPLSGADIAEAIAWVAQLPARMNVNDLVLMPAQQAGSYYTHRKL